MTATDVEIRLGEIRKLSKDPEDAHFQEQGLYMCVLEAIRDGECEDPSELARLALTAEDIDFPRWYA